MVALRLTAETFGLFLAEGREKYNITREDLAKAIGIPAVILDGWERGEGDPNLVELKKALSVFGCDLYVMAPIGERPAPRGAG